MATKNKRPTQEVKTETATITVETKQSDKRKYKPSVKVVLAADDAVKDQVSGFVTFLREHAIVGLAVGFVVGAQVQVLVKQLIASFIDPASTLLFGKKLSTQTATLHWHNRSADFGWGAFMYALVDFLFVLAVIYVVIKIFNLDKLDKKKT